MRNISKMVEHFEIRRLCNTIFGFNPHDAVIGEWIKWWLDDSLLGERRKRRIINPAIMAQSGKKRTVADILFAEKTRVGSDNYKVLGVAEIENNKNKFMEKLENLAVYERAMRRKQRKFPDLVFALLCIKTRTDYFEDGPAVPKNAKLVDSVKRKMRDHSKESDLNWILCSLRFAKVIEDATFRVGEYVRGYDRFWYNSRFVGCDFFIYSKGRLRKCLAFTLS